MLDACAQTLSFYIFCTIYILFLFSFCSVGEVKWSTITYHRMYIPSGKNKATEEWKLRSTLLCVCVSILKFKLNFYSPKKKEAKWKKSSLLVEKKLKIQKKFFYIISCKYALLILPYNKKKAILLFKVHSLWKEYKKRKIPPLWMVVVNWKLYYTWSKREREKDQRRKYNNKNV